MTGLARLRMLLIETATRLQAGKPQPVTKRAAKGKASRRSLAQEGEGSSGAGYSVIEVTLIILIIMLLSGVSINAAINQWREEEIYAVVQQLAGWIGNVQRAAMRGVRCDITIAPTSGTVAAGDVMASVSQASGTTLPSGCLTYASLRVEALRASAEFTISPSPLTFSFTPRGTIANSSTDPVLITVGSSRGGGSRCLRLDGLLGRMRIGVLNGGVCKVS